MNWLFLGTLFRLEQPIMLRYYIYIWKRHVTEAISRTAKLLRDAPKGGSAYSRESK